MKEHTVHVHVPGHISVVAILVPVHVCYSGGVNVQYEWQKKSVPEVASAIWSQSAIGEVRYRRFHCIHKNIVQATLHHTKTHLKRNKMDQAVSIS